VFDLLGAEPRVRTSPAMKGLIQSALNAANDGFENTARDGAILESVMKISHFGRSEYWMACAYAEALGEKKIKSILMKSLREKEDAIHDMMQMTESDIIPRIQREDRAQASRGMSPRARSGVRGTKMAETHRRSA
jgi:ferritin-like metal-binding protein YciE